MVRHLLVALVLLLPRLGQAQSDDDSVERARTLFGEGVGQHEARRYHEAVETFRAVLAIRAAPAVRYNLALNLFELGEYPEADEQVELLLADPGAPEDLKASARELRTHMEERGGQLVVDTSAHPAGAVVKIDGYSITDPTRPARVISGSSHQVALVVDGRAVASEVVAVEVGGTETVALEPGTAGGTDPFELGPSAPVVKDWRFWAALGVVAAVALTIVIVTVVDDDDSGGLGVPLLSWE